MDSAKEIFITWTTGAVLLLAWYAAASLRVAPPQGSTAMSKSRLAQDELIADADGSTATSKSRLFTLRKTLMYVSLYATDPKINRDHLVNCADHLSFRLRWSEGIPRDFAKRVFVMRIRLDPDRMRAHKMSTEEVMQAMKPSGIFRRDDWLAASRVFRVQEFELMICVQKFNRPEQFGLIVLRANSAGEILQLKDVGQAELVSTLFNISSEVDGHPAATFALDQPPDSDAAEVVEDVSERLKVLKNMKQSCKLGIELQTIEIENRKTLYAVIETPEGSTREFTNEKCRELSAIAKGIDGIAYVTSLAGYQIRTESGDQNVGTCLIQWKGRSHRNLTARLLLEKLQQKCRTIDAHIKFFESPAVSVFVADGGFSVRVLEPTNNECPARGSGRFMDDLLNREELADFFNFLAKNYWYYELVIDNDVALQKRVSIANALESLAKIAGSEIEAKPKFRRLVEEVSHSSVENDRGERVPYREFFQLKNRLGLNEIDD